MQSFCLWKADCNQRSAQSAHLGLGDWGGESSSPTLLQKFHPSTATLTFWLFIPGSPKTLDSFILFWFFIPRSPKTLDPLPLLGFQFLCASLFLCACSSLLPSFAPSFLPSFLPLATMQARSFGPLISESSRPNCCCKCC